MIALFPEAESSTMRGGLLKIIPNERAASNARSIPQPYAVSGAFDCDAVAWSALRTCNGVSPGCAERMSATEAPTSGVEAEVPVKPKYNEESSTDAAVFCTPCAHTSGFIRPSEVGPRLLKPASVPVLSTAPTVMAVSASPGEMI